MKASSAKTTSSLGQAPYLPTSSIPALASNAKTNTGQRSCVKA
ncbi:UNVERIFIED_CONTAM: hypothetical protein GTU68_015514 [Idotea baltica]|nr:hypothetical protein [Idotea baltica]